MTALYAAHVADQTSAAVHEAEDALFEAIGIEKIRDERVRDAVRDLAMAAFDAGWRRSHAEARQHIRRAFGIDIGPA